MRGKPKILFVTNIPSPYRVFFFNEMAKVHGENFWVYYCAEIESNRNWEIPDIKHNHIFLGNNLLTFTGRVIYFNKDIWSRLKEISPDIIVTGGFTPTMLLSILYSRLFKKKHVFTTDAWELTERNLSHIHIFLRKFLYKKAAGFLPVSQKGKDNIIKYGINPSRIFVCPYIIDNTKYGCGKVDKKFDLIYIGQFIERKLPFFFLDVVEILSRKLPELKILMMGNGPLNDEIQYRISKLSVSCSFPGFIQPQDLPEYYCKSKILIFPTKSDAWGVVANEAAAAGLPIITTPFAGAAGEIIKDGKNGYVLPIDPDLWADRIYEILTDRGLYKEFSDESKRIAGLYTSEVVVPATLQALINF